MGNIDKVSHTDFHLRSSQTYVVITAFCSLLAIVGFALYGLPFFYDFYMKEFGWSRTVITSGNALGKLLVAPLFGFIAGWIIDRYGPRRMMMAGALMTGADSSWFPYCSRTRKTLWMAYCPGISRDHDYIYCTSAGILFKRSAISNR